MTNARSRLHAVVKGRVQGVGFRWFVLAKARALGLSGEVRNLENGSVEVSAEGPRADLESLAEELKEGPASSTVEGTTIEWEKYTGHFSGFEIAPTR